MVQARDERLHASEIEIRHLREDLSRVLEDYKKLRDDTLAMARAFKEVQQPLPTPHDVTSPPIADRTAASSLSRKFSTKRLFLASGPKNPSPTIPEGRALADNSSLDPSAAALAASSHLTASIAGGGPQMSPNTLPQPSPTSPAYNPNNSSRTPYNQGGMSRGSHLDHDNTGSYTGTWGSESTLRNTQPPSIRRPAATTPNPDDRDPPLSGGSMNNSTGTSSSTNPQVEIFKSFRVSIDDPCHKVLPVALKKYNITADWRQYALYIVHGDQERCLGLNERPLILFKQLDKEGRKPMFMLRKHAAPAEGHVSTVGGNDIRSVGGGNSFGWDGNNRGVQLPGGVL